MIKTGLTKADALIEECRVTAGAYIDEAGQGIVIRGGPWCRMELNASEKACLRSVADAASRAGVTRLAERAPGSDLSKHLKGQTYGAGQGSPDLLGGPWGAPF